MTELLYFCSDQTQATALVQTCAAVQGGYEITLDRTPFHPQGGGQPSDVGAIGAARVTKVLQKKGVLVHGTDAPLTIGSVVSLQVDEAARLLHSRWHTAGHLIGHALAARGYTPTRAHHWPGEARVDAVQPPSAHEPNLTVADLQQAINTLIQQDLLRVTTLHEGHREIRFGELPSFPCGGTHVTSTQLVGHCTIEDIRPVEGGIRVRYSVESISS